jgi:predicted metal-dependent hydrolase
MNQYKYLDQERKTRNNLKKKCMKLSNAFLRTEFLITVSELGMVGTSITVPIIIPVSLPISVALTICSTFLRSTSGLITKKINKHSEIELLVKAELNWIEEKFTRTIKDGKISDEEFSDIEQEIKNYENMKSSILNENKENI